MAFDPGLAERIRQHLNHLAPGALEKRVFGVVAFMINGHMACGIVRDSLMLRLDHEAAERALTRPHTRPMDFTGRPMRGMLYVEPQGTAEESDLRGWLEMAVRHAMSLPPKQPKQPKPSRSHS
ncbi:MAG: TfoX/Sxy family protein [Acidobacteria bacterium]|nr:TfoX/Sxy family protein [Acidobacteriota bacterium]